MLNYFTVYRRGSGSFITEKTILFQGSKGGPTFPRGSSFFQEGVQMLISIEPRITSDFPGGGGPDPLSSSGSAHEHIGSKLMETGV